VQHLKVTFFIAFVLVAAHSTTSAQNADKNLDWFDGTPRTFVVNGYSTSFRWPNVLQRKLDKFFDGKRVIEVKLATQGGTPIAKWMNVETGEPLPPWNLKLRPLLSEQECPTIVLAQQSLQWVFEDRADGIRNAKDAANIRKGVRAIQGYTDRLLADGADAVVVAMHIYKHSMEPAIGNERLALEHFVRTQPENVYAGPDVWEPTRKLWPQAFEADQVHPNAVGAEVMAQLWLESLLALCKREVPPWSEEEMQHAIANPPEQVAGNRRPQRGNFNLADRMKRHDKNGDGKIEKAEFQGPVNVFARFDRNEDGVVDKEELKNPRLDENKPPG
jgi:hypothetical protein